MSKLKISTSFFYDALHEHVEIVLWEGTPCYTLARLSSIMYIHYHQLHTQKVQFFLLIIVQGISLPPHQSALEWCHIARPFSSTSKFQKGLGTLQSNPYV